MYVGSGVGRRWSVGWERSGKEVESRLGAEWKGGGV